VLTDLVQIKTLGEKKRVENERFRRYLKAHDHSDRILRRIAVGVEEQIDCTTCANCCRVATVRLTTRDVENMSKALRISQARFLAEYTSESAEEGRILKRTAKGCVFLDGNLCSVYDHRPATCDDFPHVVRGNGSIVSRMWEFTDRAVYCPIVYNSLEAFKAETGFTR
jgi:Fe-S-cluster containining protein